MTDLQAHPDDHMIGHLDGFQIYRGGIDVLSICRVDQDGKAMESGRTGEFGFQLPLVCCISLIFIFAVFGSLVVAIWCGVPWFGMV